MSAAILKALGLAETESGTYLGNGEWSRTNDAGTIEVTSSEEQGTRFVVRLPRNGPVLATAFDSRNKS